MDDTTVIISVILAVSAIVGTCSVVVAGVWKLSGQISGLSARVESLDKHMNTRIDSLDKHMNTRIDSLEKRVEGIAAEVRNINEHLRHRSA